MDKLKTLILFFRQKLGRKAENVEPEEIGKYSMNEGEPDKVFGFRRDWQQYLRQVKKRKAKSQKKCCQ